MRYIVVAQADRATPGARNTAHDSLSETNPSLDSGTAQPNEATLQQIIITAQYRKERLVDTPLSVSVLSGDYLRSIGATQFIDWANTVPGLSFDTSGAGYTEVAIRGITTGPQDISPTVAIYVDGVPYGSSTPFALGPQLSLDLATIDLSRIDVLKGPQGTLYGASAMGGLIQYVTNPPDLHELSATVRSGASATHFGDTNYDDSLTLNAPFAGDKAAIRATGYYTRDGGFIDDPVLHQTDVGASKTEGGRLDLLVTPVSQLNVRIGAVAQNISRTGQEQADYSSSGAPLYGALVQERHMSEPFIQQFRIVGATIDYNADFATFTSISSYQTNRSSFIFDESALFVPLFSTLGLVYDGVGFSDNMSTDRLTQEVRLVSQNTTRIKWLVGGYFTRESSRETIYCVTENTLDNPVANDFIYYISDPSLYKESAIYGDLTVALTSRLDITGGLRVSHDQLTYDQSNETGIFAEPEPPASSGASVITYLANARFHITANSTGYIRYATGYRPGGPNFILRNPTTGQPEGPATFKADSLRSWELGYKGQTRGQAFGVDADVYYTFWNDIQTTAILPNEIPGIENAPGGAISKGIELAVNARPMAPLLLTGSLDLMDAYIRHTEPALAATAGEDLPNAPHFSGAFDAAYSFGSLSYHPAIGATLRYVDARSGFLGSPLYHLPPYTTADVRAGFTIGAAAVQLYAHNIFDARGQLSVQSFGAPDRITLLQPRTIGISATLDF